MRKMWFLLVFLLAVPQLSAADTGFQLGMKASPNISWHRPETRGFERNGVLIGFSYGLIADYYFAENYAVSSGLHIVHTGGKLKYRYMANGFDTDKRRDYQLNYIEIPLTVKLRTEEIGYISYFGQFGLGVGFNTKAEADERIPSQDPAKGVDVSDDVTFARGAMIIGAGLEYNFGGRTSVVAGLVFNNGFSNVLKKDNPFDPNAPSPSSMVNYLEVTLGVMF